MTTFPRLWWHAGLVACLFGGAVRADFNIDWFSIDGGGGKSTGGGFELTGTIGQHDASAANVMTGGGYTLTGGFWAISSGPAPSITGWRSVRTHSGAGLLGITLNPTATGNGGSGPTSEPRDKGIQQIEVAFNVPVVLANPATVQVTGQTTVANSLQPEVSYTPASVSLSNDKTLVITLPAAPAPGAIPDRTCCRISIAGAVTGLLGEGLQGDSDCRVRSLFGDVNSTGDTNIGDTLVIKSKLNGPVASNAPYDVNLTGGAINLGDGIAVKSRLVSGYNALCP